MHGTGDSTGAFAQVPVLRTHRVARVKSMLLHETSLNKQNEHASVQVHELLTITFKSETQTSSDPSKCDPVMTKLKHTA